MNNYPHPVSVAPMMDYTDRHFRYLLRLISRHSLLYTEMITCEALLHSDARALLDYHPIEHPLALQLGGSDPKKLAHCAKMAQDWGYDEVNLNAGCPSDRVKSGRFGACLMKEPTLVAKCLAQMQQAVTIPITLKTRLGVDDCDSYDYLCRFIETIASAGCQVFILHARKAWLKGLSPKENRTVPPLRHEVVYQLKQQFPHLTLVLNGGLTTLEQLKTALTTQQPAVNGVMIGRQVCQNPYLLASIDQLFYAVNQPPLSRQEVAKHYMSYLEVQLRAGARLQSLTRHLLGLFYGTPQARSWRRYISEHSYQPTAGIEVINNALAQMT